MRAQPLTPSGTARERFLRAYPRAPAGETTAAHFPEDLFASVQAREDGPEMLFTAWEIIRGGNGLDAPTERGLLALTLVSLAASRYGSTRVPISGPEGETFLTRLFTELGVPAPDPAIIRRLVEEATARQPGPARGILGSLDDYTPLVTDGTWLSQRRLLHYESRLGDTLRARLAAPPRPMQHEKAILALLRKSRPIVRGREIELSKEQERAVLTAVKSSLTIVTGGPGTGKTSIVVSILRALVREGVATSSIALAAPTGKAANRMQEAIGKYLHDIPDLADRALLKTAPRGTTVHRLLGYQPERDRFSRHENNQLDQDVVIVDESSMIDVFLMDRLLRAVRPDARLVLLGDADQLPSVEAGAVFRDVAKAAGACDLKTSFRMDPGDPAGRNILAVAQTINGGTVGELFQERPERETVPVRQSAADIAFEKVELLEAGASQLDAFLDRWWEERARVPADLERLVERKYHYPQGRFDPADVVSLQKLASHFESSRILCLTRGRWPRTGAGAVNEAVHARAVEAWRARGPGRGAQDLLRGEPLLVQKNDYQRGIFNGDQGLVLRVQFDGDGSATSAAVFPQAGTFVAFPLDGLRPILSLAYATTVHKAQGSEFDSVALVLPAEDTPLLTREILYTAITRSRRSVTIVGSRQIVERGASRKIERYSGIAEALKVTRPAPGVSRVTDSKLLPSA